MAPLLKICGLRQVDQALAVARLGVDAIGVIGVRASPRWVPPAERSALFAGIATAAPACRRVLVLADPSAQELADLGFGGGPTGGGGGPTVLQLHGDETPQQCSRLRQQLPGLELWKALRLRQPGDLAGAQAFVGVVDALLLDAWVPDQLGGTGHRIPLEWLVGFEPALPWWLAGGIRADRIAAVQQALCPTGLDASSGVEHAPGDKDLAAVEALVAAVGHWPNRRR
ncbi:MAG: phosphoribosylanthranilate isomerase [Cyanobacteriota bacterium]|nr:phosphoribosylanthranilate isomerase [Cyanobacteriota bacterium]